MIASGAEREAMNMPIQGTSADIIKISMIEIDKMLDEGGYESTLLIFPQTQCCNSPYFWWLSRYPNIR